MLRVRLLLLACFGLLAAALPASGELRGEVAAASWPAYGAGPGGGHFSRAEQITPANVDQLELAWQHRSGDIRQRGSHEGFPLTPSSLQVTPIVVDDRLFYCTPFNRVFALDATTGKEVWSYDPVIDRNADFMTSCRGVSSWRSGQQGFCEHRILMGTQDARLIALDADTGRPCTDFGELGSVDVGRGLTEHDPMEYAITSPPAILGNKVITGAMVLDNLRTDSPSGLVRAYDIRSGELLWAWHSVKPGTATHDAEGRFRSGTTNVWSIIAVDEQRDMVFLPTGNTTPDFYGGHRGDLDYYSSSVVALHGASGEVAWHYQTVHHDIWDYDVPAQPTLTELRVAGELVPAVVQVTKTGMTFALHRDTGEPLWPVQELPVPQRGGVPEEVIAPTQPFPTHIPHLLARQFTSDDIWGMAIFDKLACRKKLDGMLNEGLFTPPSTQGSLHNPYSGGGNNWGSPAIHPDTGVMVVYTSRVPGYVKLIPREECGEGRGGRQAGTPYCVKTGMLVSPLGVPCSKPPWGTLDAIDLNAGKILWSVPLGDASDLTSIPFVSFKGLPGIAAPMMTASGLVFSGISNGHRFYAFDAGSGAELWSAELPTGANALPMTYQVKGRQYVVIAAGGHWSGGSPPSDHIMAFALPDP